MKIVREQYLSAEANMGFDERMLKSGLFYNDFPVFRAYLWDRPGITYSYNKGVPEDFDFEDMSSRPTGGGIVFHSPGDIVFSCLARLDDPFFPKKIKCKMGVVSSWVRLALVSEGIPVDDVKPIDPMPDIQFCVSYPNPDECFVNGQKVLGLTMRRWKAHFLIQGIIHVQNNFDYFSEDLGEYATYFTRGLGMPGSERRLMDRLIRVVESHD